MPTKVSAEEQKMLAKRQVLLDEYKTDAEKRKVAIEMAKDVEGAKILIGLAADNKLSEDLIKAAGPNIRRNADQTVRTMAKEYFPWKRPVEPTGSTETIAASTASTVTSTPAVSTPVTAVVGSNSEISQIAALTGNERTGQAVFKTNCATCHRHKQLGNDVGPELTQIHQKFDKNALLDAILNPSAGIAFGYEPWLITTKTGQTYYGFMVSDGEQSVVIKGVTGQKHTVPTDKIASRRQYKTSLMPNPEVMGLKPQQLADLTAFLLKQ